MTVGQEAEANDRAERGPETISSSWPWKSLYVLIAIVGIVLMLLLWNVLQSAERNHINRLTDLAANAMVADLVENTQDRANALRHLAKAWVLQSPGSRAEWNAFATMFILHHPGCVAVEYVDSTYRVRDVASIGNDQSDMGRDLSLDPSLRAAFELALEKKDVTPTPIEDLPDGTKARTYVMPVFNREQFRGFVLSRVDVARVLEDMTTDVSGLGYSVEITEGGRELYIRPGADRQQLLEWGRTARLQLRDLDWTVRAWPRPELLSQLRPRLPGLALSLPLTFTILLLLMLRFVQVTSTHARQMEATNEQLSAEMHLRQRIEDELRESEARFVRALNISPDAIISINEELKITLFNQGAEAAFGYKAEEAIGQGLELLLPARFRSAHIGHLQEFRTGELQMKKLMGSRTVPGLRKDGSEFPLEASISKLDYKGETIYTAILRDVTARQLVQEELRRAHDELEVRVQERTAELQFTNQALEKEIAERKEGEEMLRQLSGRLLQAQDEERRRVARELHDSTAQYLAALALNIAFVQKSTPELPEHLVAVLSETSQLVDRCTSEIRTMSYLLHPPLLDDLGLTSALQWYAGGFTKRSGVDVQLELSPNLGRLPADHERAYFRIVQECLTNVRKHSGASVAKIRLTECEDGIHLEVSDNGCGMPGITQTMSDMGALLGVGIAGMRERVRQLGGRLEMSSTNKGSMVIAVLPKTYDVSDPGVGVGQSELDEII